MKTINQHSEVVTSGVTHVSNFTIKNSHRAFQVLSSSLYSDKIRAIVRELSTNASDAHREAGIPDVPFEVKLPNIFDLEFYIKDFGPGLSKDQVIGYQDEQGNWVSGLYNTYFESTKNESNDYTGMLGLGSKSPFSYVSNFVVESRQQGTISVYSCFKDSAGLPAVTLLTESPTEEPNGLTIKLSVRRDDISKFVDAAQKVYMYFDLLPTVIGVEDFIPHWIKKEIVGSNWYIRNASSSANMSGPYIIQGQIPYPIDSSIVNETDTLLKMLLELPIDITVPIGSVDVSASREHLSYDPTTVNNVKSILEQVWSEIYNSIQTRFDGCTSPWEAGQLHVRLETSNQYNLTRIYKKIHNHKPFVWNDASIPRHVLVHDIEATIQEFYVDYNKKLRLSSTYKNVDSQGCYLPIRGEVCVIVDEYHHGRDRYKAIFNQSINESGCLPHLFVIRSPKRKQLIDDQELETILSAIGNPNYVRTVPNQSPSRTTRTASSTKTSSDHWVWRIGTSYSGRNCWNTRTVDLTKGGYYVDVKRYMVYHKDQEVGNFKCVVDAALKLGIIDNQTPIVGFTSRWVNKCVAHGNWKNLIDVMIDYMQQPNIKASYAYTKIVNEFGPNTMIPHLIENNVKLPDSMFTKWVSSVKKIKPATPLSNHFINNVIHALRSNHIKYSTTYDELWTEYNDVCKHYPLMPHLSNIRAYTDDINQFITYISIVEQHNRSMVK